MKSRYNKFSLLLMVLFALYPKASFSEQDEVKKYLECLMTIHPSLFRDGVLQEGFFEKNSHYCSNEALYMKKKMTKVGMSDEEFEKFKREIYVRTKEIYMITIIKNYVGSITDGR